MAQESFIFWPGGGKDPGLSHGSLEMRRRIAQQLAARQRGMPKNVGEGLTYLGESIGEAGLMWRLEQAEQARAAALREQTKDLIPEETPAQPAQPAPAPVRAPPPPPPPPQAALPPAPAPVVAPQAALPPEMPPIEGPTSVAPPMSASFSDRFAGDSAPADVPDTGPPIGAMAPPWPGAQTSATQPGAQQVWANVDAVQGRPPEPPPRPPGAIPVQTESFRRPEPQAAVAAAAPSPQAPPGDDRWPARLRALSGIESGGSKTPYQLLGAVTKSGDRAHGKYQVMGNNIAAWTKDALGRPLSRAEFLASPEAQDATVRHRFGQYVDRYGDEGAAKAWYAGEKGMRNPNATDVHGRLTVAGYGQDFLRRMAADGGAPRPGGVAPVQTAAASAPAPSQRDAVALALLEQGGPTAPPPQAPAQPADELGSEGYLRDVTGAGRPGSPFLANSVASRGDIGSDAGTPLPRMSPVGPGVGAGIADSVAQRNRITDSLNQQPRTPALEVPPVGPTQTAATPPPVLPPPGGNPQVTSDITPAPPIVTPNAVLAQATAQARTPAPPPQAEAPRTEMQRPEMPAVPQKAPMSEQERKAWKYKLANPDDPDVARIADTLIAPLQKKREEDYARDVDAYKSKMTLHNKLMEDYEKAKIEHVTVDGRLLQRDGKGGWTDVTPNTTTAGGIPNVAATESQSKDLMFHGWAAESNDILKGKDKILAEGLSQELAGKVPFVGNALQTAQYRQAKTAAKTFIQAFLRKTSGAAIGDKELATHMDTLIPKYGDDAKTMADKARQREGFVDNLYVGLGKARPLADYSIKLRADKRNEDDRKLNEEMKDAPRIEGKVLIDKATGRRRALINGRWEDL